VVHEAKMDVVDSRLAGDVQEVILMLTWQRGCCGTLERNRSGILPKITTLHRQFTYGVLDRQTKRYEAVPNVDGEL